VGYHAVNLLLHLASILLLWVALGRIVSREARVIAVAIFAVHPFQTDPVNYIFARSTLLATLLCIAALLSWTREHRWWAVAWFAAALLAKEECVAFPVFLLLLAIAKSRLAKEWKPIAVMFALSIAAGLRVMVLTRSIAGSGAGTQAGVSAQSYLLAQGPAILRYLRMLMIPWGFTVDPDIPIPPVWLGVSAWLAVMALAAVCLLHFKGARAGFWFIAGLVLLLPSSSIFPANDLAADRRMYLPMIGFAVCAGLLLERVRPVYLAAGLVVLIGLSFYETMTWRTEESLWTNAVEEAPGKLRPKIQLARAVEPQRALAILDEAQQVAPNDWRVATERGRVYLLMGNPGQALVEFGRALALAPREADAFNNRGAALLALDQKDAAREDFEQALSIDACEFNARVNLLHLGVQSAAPEKCHFSAEQMATLRGN
jgi:protein O-mannosyl-transferase